MTQPPSPPTGPNRKPTKPRPWEPDSSAEGSSFGAWLRRQREVREISLREVANATKISRRYLEALENDEFDALPAPVFARGFLREYARYVGLDPDEAVNSYLTAQQRLRAAEEAVAAPQPRPRGRRAAGLAAAALGLAALAAGGILALRWLRGAEARPDGTARASEPAGAPPALALPQPEPGAEGGAIPEGPLAGSNPKAAGAATPGLAAPAAPLVLTMDFAADCWVEIQVDGRRFLNELHVQGESVRIEAQERIRIATLGNASAVHVELNGRPFPLPLGPGQTVLRDLEIILPESGGAPREAAE